MLGVERAQIGAPVVALPGLVEPTADLLTGKMAPEQCSDSAVGDERKAAAVVLRDNRPDSFHNSALRSLCSFPAVEAGFRFGKESVCRRFKLIRWQEARRTAVVFAKCLMHSDAA